MRSTLIVLLALGMFSCKVYKRDLLFRFDEEFPREQISESVYRASLNYVIEVGEELSFTLYANDGAVLIDPYPDTEILGSPSSGEGITYLVKQNGNVRLPILGEVQISGLTLAQAEELLEEKYGETYKGCFVKLEPGSRRVIILGTFGSGGGSQGGGRSSGQGASGGITQGVQGGSRGRVLELEHENMTVVEVVAMAGGIPQGSNSAQLRLIRGELTDPQVYEIDLSTISGMKRSAMIVESGDILYLEPWRRPFRQTLAEFSPFFNMTTSILAFIVLIQNSGK